MCGGGGKGGSCGLDDVLYGLSWKVSGSVGYMERMYVTYLLDRMDSILGSYRCCKKKKRVGVVARVCGRTQADSVAILARDAGGV